FDLSLPSNVDPTVSQLPEAELVNLDQLATVAAEHIRYRKDQLDAVLGVVQQHVDLTLQWWMRRQRYGRLRQPPHSVKRQSLAAGV
ncbi:MAG: hypothetical protein R3330_18250, partial [Saprospiraceae bacterium]|nr:hypothetical protein [Saprospiraceae bacterium]